MPTFKVHRAHIAERLVQTAPVINQLDVIKFRLDMFALAGEDKGFGSPDGLWFDPRGVLWIETDVSTSALNRGPYAKIGNNRMLAADINHR